MIQIKSIIGDRINDVICWTLVFHKLSKYKNIADFILAVPFEISNTDEVFNFEM